MEKSRIPIFGRTVEDGSEDVFQYNCTSCDKDGNFKEATNYCPICNILYCDRCISKHQVPEHRIVLVSNWGQKEDDSCSLCTNDSMVTKYCTEHEVFCCTACARQHQCLCQNIYDIGRLSKNVWNSDDLRSLRRTIDCIKSDVLNLKCDMYTARAMMIQNQKDTKETIRSFREKINRKLDTLEDKADREIDSMCSDMNKSLEHDLTMLDDIISDLQLQTMYIESKRATETKMFIKMKKLQKHIKKYSDTMGVLSNSSTCLEYILFEIDVDVLNFVETMHTLGEVKRDTSEKITSEDIEIISSSQNVQASHVSQVPEKGINETDTSKHPMEPSSLSADQKPVLTKNDHIPGKSLKPHEIPKLKLQTVVAETTKPKSQLSSRSVSSDQFSERNMSASSLSPESVLIPRKLEYNIRLKEDMLQCNIQGICGLPNGNILISDVRNKKIKLLDKHYSIVDYCQLTAGPHCMCCTGPQEAAVALNNQSIQFFACGNEMKLTRSIELKHSCYGLSHFNGKLYVTKMNGKKVYVYNTSGHRLHDMSSVDLAGTEKFASTQHVYVTKDGARIYVADFEKGLVSVDGRGKLLSSLAQSSLRSACGVCTDTSGNVYVSGWQSHNVVKYGNRGTQALGEVVKPSDGVYYPTCILYDSSKSKLIVSNNPGPKGSDILCVFSV